MTPEQIRQEAEREYPIDPLFRYLERLVNSTNRKAYIKGRMKSLEEKEKEIAELVDCLQETIRCCAVFKDNMLSADVTISEHCDQIEVAKQILKKHNS